MTLTAKQISFRLCAWLSVGLTVWFTLAARGLTYELEREVWLLRATGYSALGALFLSVSMTPLSRVFTRLLPYRKGTAIWLAFRRSFGITAAAFGLAHGGLVLSTFLLGAWPAVVKTPYLRAGLVTLSILIALLLTSFPQMTRRLRIRHWPHLHRLSYVAVLFLFQHLLLSPFAPRTRVLALFGGLLVVSLLRWLRKTS